MDSPVITQFFEGCAVRIRIIEGRTFWCACDIKKVLGIPRLSQKFIPPPK